MDEVSVARQRARGATIAVWFNLACGAAFVAGEIYAVVAINAFGRGAVDIDTLRTSDTIGMLTGFISLAALITTIVLVARWIMAANRAAWSRSPEMEITPGWAVGWYFVPIANLWKPFEAMSEIWRASASPDDPYLVPVPTLLRWWWGLWLASSILNNLSTRLSLRAETLDQIATASWISIATFPFDVALTVVFVRVIEGITRLQGESGANAYDRELPEFAAS